MEGSLFDRLVHATDELHDATADFDRQRYQRAALARIAIIHDGLNIDYLMPRGPEA